MDLIFAKFIFTAAAILGPAPSDLPVLLQVTPKIAEVYQMVAIAEDVVREPCPPGPPGVVVACPGPLFVMKQFQTFCMGPGVYTVTVRLGLIAQAPVGGHLWLVGEKGESLVSSFRAAPGAPAYMAASLQVPAPARDTCFDFRFESSGPVEVIAEPGVSFVTIGR